MWQRLMILCAIVPAACLFAGNVKMAYIPSAADPATIRFAGVRLIRVPAKVKLSTDTRYCEELKFREPGGSMFCPYAETAGSEMAYEVQYSYTGPPLASDESAGSYFTFRVYFRPGELPKPAPQASSFRLNISRASVPRRVIDEANSTFCDVHVAAGYLLGKHKDCHDHVVYSTVLVPSDYWTVQVGPEK